MNDAADPLANAAPGDTPGSLGINDGAGSLANGRGPLPARILQSLMMGATAFRRVRMRQLLKIDLPETPELVCQRLGGVVNQGFFEVHVGDYACEDGSRTVKAPDVKVIFNEASYQYEISSITIHTIKIINSPDPRAFPRAGDNVTNDESLGVRTPEYDAEGKGYWKAVIANMNQYEMGMAGGLQWGVPGDASAYHEEIHNQQFRSAIKKYNDSLLKKIETQINDVLEGLGTQELSEERVARVARKELMSTTRNLTTVRGTDGEAEAYKKTFAVKWKPEIEKIRRYAREHGWDKK